MKLPSAEENDAVQELIAALRGDHRASRQLVQEAFALLNGPARERLKAKQQWEHMSALGVLCEWGDPREWPE